MTLLCHQRSCAGLVVILILIIIIISFKYLGSQVAADGGCERDVVHRMNEGYRAWGALKSVQRMGSAEK